MANTYTEDLKLRKPAAGDLEWDDEMHDNSDITEVVLKAILKRNRVVSGIVPTAGTGLQVDYTGGQVDIDGTLHTISAGNKTCTAQSKNWLYVNASGTVVISTNPPTGTYVPIALVDAGASSIDQVADFRNLSGELVSSFMRAILDDADLATMLTSMGIAEFLRNMLQATTSAGAVGYLGILGIFNSWTKAQSYAASTLSIVTGNVALSFLNNCACKLPLTEHATMLAPSDLGANRKVLQWVKQNTAGGNTLSWNTAYEFGGEDLSVNLNGDAETLYYHAVDPDGSTVKSFKIWETA